MKVSLNKDIVYMTSPSQNQSADEENFFGQYNLVSCEVNKMSKDSIYPCWCPTFVNMLLCLQRATRNLIIFIGHFCVHKYNYIQNYVQN